MWSRWICGWYFTFFSVTFWSSGWQICQTLAWLAMVYMRSLHGGRWPPNLVMFTRVWYFTYLGGCQLVGVCAYSCLRYVVVDSGRVVAWSHTAVVDELSSVRSRLGSAKIHISQTLNVDAEKKEDVRIDSGVCHSDTAQESVLGVAEDGMVAVWHDHFRYEIGQAADDEAADNNDGHPQGLQFGAVKRGGRVVAGQVDLAGFEALTCPAVRGFSGDL